ncbi:inorganic phosphate transporter [Lutibacter sp.]|uniref:inorganic phosphate transporter n=1 Tax=Lutibacter sp. TaxID=1925666 RepID=UPI002736C166|nr:inorganic phosphate transporter [Lutibacter sp.]MDP3313161.1 inorganic phosphate transporter [Lutibacter sp.]
MDNLYFYMIIALGVLAIVDLIVGVSNDAVNFLNSAIGSKAVSMRTILIVASVGVALGAIFSSGMMEVARKGIFNPEMLMFSDIMIIFMAVMITDILLLDFFNTIGMPTSTTVSIVFELLGAAVAMALIKISIVDGHFSDVVNYINTSKATEIIVGILLSVVIAFTVGMLVQYVARLLLSFNFEKKATWIGALFGGIGLTSIIYFILLKGIKDTGFAAENYDFLGGMTISHFLEKFAMLIILLNLAFWFAISYILMSFFKVNVYKIIILAGTFGLALAFAGNDLVNFIGVPIAAYQSYEVWSVSGIPATEFGMGFLADKVPTPTILLFLSGIVMVLTLWFSKKARYVTQTEINLSREGSSKERFQPNFLSRSLVKSTKAVSKYFLIKTPKPVLDVIEKQFEKPAFEFNSDKTQNLPAFDYIRASVNLMVASVLIAVATSYKLPLSTTYVTFMVAMGSSLSDRAWGSESAVYRVAGVLNVIGGWFFTAFIAFVSAALMAYLIYSGGNTMIIVLLVIAAILIFRNSMLYLKKSRQIPEEDSLSSTQESSFQGVVEETGKNISKVFKRVNKIEENTIDGLINQDIKTLEKAKKTVGKLEVEIEDLQNNIFYFIKNLQESSVNASTFYINVIGELQDITQSVGFINKISHKHIKNHHSSLKKNQAKELIDIQKKLEVIFSEVEDLFNTMSFYKIQGLNHDIRLLLQEVSKCAQMQVERTRTTESSPKNATLYFNILLEIEDMLKSTMNLLDLNSQHN